MPRANRYILPGQVCHLTHRCHNRSFLLRFAAYRNEYRRRLRSAAEQFRVPLLDYCITSNHTHLLTAAPNRPAIGRFMQKLEGEFAAYYNHRKARNNSFWGERYHCTMVESGEHLLRCMTYIDLNMVRAGTVTHPREWEWCGYHEIVGSRKRYRVLDLDRLMELVQVPDIETLAKWHAARIDAAIAEGLLRRQAVWTESLAVGSPEFVRATAGRFKRRKRLTIATDSDGYWYVHEPQVDNWHHAYRDEPI